MSIARRPSPGRAGAGSRTLAPRPRQSATAHNAKPRRPNGATRITNDKSSIPNSRCLCAHFRERSSFFVPFAPVQLLRLCFLAPSRAGAGSRTLAPRPPQSATAHNAKPRRPNGATRITNDKSSIPNSQCLCAHFRERSSFSVPFAPVQLLRLCFLAPSRRCTVKQFALFPRHSTLFEENHPAPKRPRHCAKATCNKDSGVCISITYQL